MDATIETVLRRYGVEIQTGLVKELQALLNDEFSQGVKIGQIVEREENDN